MFVRSAVVVAVSACCMALPSVVQADTSSGTTSPQTVNELVSGEAAASLSLSIPGAFTFPQFSTGTGTAQDLFTSIQNATVTTTGSDTTLTVTDSGLNGVAPGHLSNFVDQCNVQSPAGSGNCTGPVYTLVNALVAHGNDTDCTALGLGATCHDASLDGGATATLDQWTAPQDSISVPIRFEQVIGATEALRTGFYTTELVFDLSDPDLG